MQPVRAHKGKAAARLEAAKADLPVLPEAQQGALELVADGVVDRDHLLERGVELLGHGHDVALAAGAALAGLPLEFDGKRPPYRNSAPTLGQHSRDGFLLAVKQRGGKLGGVDAGGQNVHVAALATTAKVVTVPSMPP
jgi:hypothetical protein